MPRQPYLPVWRQSVLPVHLLCQTPLLVCIGPAAGDVKLQGDKVMDHPVVPEFMRAAFVFPSAAVVPMAKAGEVPKFLRWGHGEAWELAQRVSLP